MLCNQNKPFHSSMSTRKARFLGDSLAIVRLLLYVEYIKEFMVINQNILLQ